MSKGESPLARRICRSEKRKSFPKKIGGILRKRNRLEAYRFIDEYRDLSGVRWLLRRLEIYPNAYYNYRKHRQAKDVAQHEISCIKFKAYIMKPKALLDIAECGFIWHTMASIFPPSRFISI